MTVSRDSVDGDTLFTGTIENQKGRWKRVALGKTLELTRESSRLFWQDEIKEPRKGRVSLKRVGQ